MSLVGSRRDSDRFVRTSGSSPKPSPLVLGRGKARANVRYPPRGWPRPQAQNSQQQVADGCFEPLRGMHLADTVWNRPAHGPTSTDHIVVTSRQLVSRGTSPA